MKRNGHSDENGDQEMSSVLRLENVRSTAQRRVILEVFSKVEGHMTLEELHAAVNEVDPSVAISTIYRTMRLLITHGHAFELHFDGHATRYERRSTHHDHLICRECNAIVEFEDPRLEKLQEMVAARHGFDLQTHRHELYGICPSCRAKGRGSNGDPH